jgi:hypothetical protein
MQAPNSGATGPNMLCKRCSSTHPMASPAAAGNAVRGIVLQYDNLQAE